MIHANRQQGSRRTIDLSVRSDPNPRISEWPMPGTDTSKAFSGCLQKQKHKICDDFCDLPIDKCHYISVQPCRHMWQNAAWELALLSCILLHMPIGRTPDMNQLTASGLLRSQFSGIRQMMNGMDELLRYYEEIDGPLW